MRGDLVESFAKGAATVTRAMEPDRLWTSPSGEAFALHGSSVMFVRNVGHLMTTPMLTLPNGAEAPEVLCAAVITSIDRKSTRLNSSHYCASRIPPSS